MKFDIPCRIAPHPIAAYEITASTTRWYTLSLAAAGIFQHRIFDSVGIFTSLVKLRAFVHFVPEYS
jgi:hypothetical protein